MNAYSCTATSSPDRAGRNILTDQVIVGGVLQLLAHKREEYAREIARIARDAAARQQDAYRSLSDALGYVDKVRDFVSPQHLGNILGSLKSKHGEIAEQVEVQITNARAVFRNLLPIADIESVGRTAPEDYLVNGVPVQSKFAAGFNRTLDLVTEHLNKYPEFARDAAQYGYPGKAGYYHIPRDQFETIQKILHGDSGEFNNKTVRACLNFVEEIETKTGKAFQDVVRPSISNYREVQLGTIDRTLDGYETQFKEETHRNLTKIDEEAKSRAHSAREAVEPGLGGAAQAGAIGALIGGAVSGSVRVYSKIRGGKRLHDFTTEDWKEVGVDFGKGAVRGGISGAGIYALTQLGGFSAPFAGAMVSTGIGIASLALDYRAGRISRGDFCDAACALSVEAGLTAVGSAIGSALIPVPVVGTVVGAMTARAAIGRR